MKKNAKPSFKAAAANDVVPAYTKATGALAQQMHEIMDPLDRNPDYFENVLNYGHAPLRQLGELMKSSPRSAADESKLQGALRLIDIHLKAGVEVQRRYEEEYINEAKRAYKESKDPEDKLYLADVKARQAQFAEHLKMLRNMRHTVLSHKQPAKKKSPPRPK